MNKIIFVSNRLPITIQRKKTRFSVEPSSGGLITALSSFEKMEEKVWIGWPGIISRKNKAENDLIRKELKKLDYKPVFLYKSHIDDYYYGFCNETIWPLFHYFVQYAVYEKRFWESYKNVNHLFCKAVLEVADKNDYIWIHDYHLMLLPNLIRDKIPEAKIGFFLHIPFPSSEIYRLMPWCTEVIEGLLGADIIGFHTFDYVRHFAESVRRILGLEHTLGQITVGGRVVRVDSFPMGIDYNKFSDASMNEEVINRIKSLRKEIGVKDKVILSIDRLDYTKGIPQRLEAYDYFLDKYSKYKQRVVFIVIAVPSRTEVEHYRKLKENVEILVGKINGKHGTIGWTPVSYLYRSFDFLDLVSLYSIADVLFITPLRDGMNLVAKEYVATKRNGKGVLILGEMAGTAKELGEAIIINPNDLENSAKSLKIALEMSDTEQVRRMKSMQRRLKRYDIRKWSNDFMERFDQIKDIQYMIKSKELSQNNISKLLNLYHSAENRLLLLDYDGTLMPFHNDPAQVRPDRELVNLLKSLNNIKKNHIIIVSGRDKATLDDWIGKLCKGIVAEHGVWIKNRKWNLIDNLESEWKNEIRPMLEVFVDRTPGSLLEEKEFSLVWHYRKVDPSLAIVRVGELKYILTHATANQNIGVLEGNKVIEVKNTAINKGKAVRHWLDSKHWDFILSIGDDWTDEDVFSILPDNAYSVKVGIGTSRAKYKIHGFREVRDLLSKMT